MNHSPQTIRDSAEAELFRLLVENVRDYAIFVVDPTGLVRSWNPGAQRLLGYAEEEIIGRSAAVFFTPHDINGGVPDREMARAVATGRGEDERWHIRKDGSRFWSGGTITPLWDEGHCLQGFARIMRDRTAQKISADGLRDALAYAEGVVETVREPLLVLGSDLRIKTANRSFYQTFRVSAVETEGRLIYDLGNRQWDIPLLRTLLEEILPENTSFDGFEVEHPFVGIGRKVMLLNARRFSQQDNQTELILLAIEDITLRRLAEDERCEIETRFTSLVKNIQDHAIFTMNLAGHITSWNVEAERILGYSEAEIRGQPFALIFTLKDQAADIPEQELRLARDVGRAVDERWHVRKDGQQFWALGIITPTHDARGRHTGYSKILRDRTERKQAKEELQRAHDEAENLVQKRTAELQTANEGLQHEIEERKRAKSRLSALHAATKVLAESPSLGAAIPQAIEAVCQEMAWAWAGVWMLDPLGTRLGLTQFWHTASPALDQFLTACQGKTFTQGEGVPGRVWAASEPVWVPNVLVDDDFLGKHSASRAGLHAAVAFPILQGRDIVGVIEFFSQRVEDPDEKIFEMMTAIGNQIGQFIERKRVEEGLRLFRTLIDQTTDGIEVIDPETGRFLDVNEKACVMSGYTREEYLRLSVVDMNPVIAFRTWAETMEAHQRAGFQTIEAQHRRKDGSTFPIEVSLSFVQLNRAYLVAVVRDITERKQLEDQFHQAQKMEAFGQLAGGVAHDFNNLLTVISGYSELVLVSLHPDDPNHALIKEIYAAGERAVLLTRQLLTFSRKQVVQPQVLNLNTVVTSAGNMLARLIGEDMTLATILSPDLGQVHADPGQLEQVIMNLVVNARDAMPGGGRISVETAAVHLDRRYERSHPAVRPGRYVLLAVSDTGCGMTAEVKSRMFEPFFTTKEVGKGTGLGLATVFGIVKQSGGFVWVYSEIGQGTTIKVYLPSVEKLVPTSRLDEEAPGIPGGTETILLVEDDPAVRMLTRCALQANGYTVLEAAGGAEAILLCERHSGPIHMLVSDVVMPKMGGRKLAERLKARYPGMRVMFISGYTDDSVVRHGVLHAEVAFLQKPFSMDALHHKVRAVLDATT